MNSIYIQDRSISRPRAAPDQVSKTRSTQRELEAEMTKRLPTMATCAIMLGLAAAGAHAAVMPVDSATFDSALAGGRMTVDTDHDLTSITVGGTTYTQLEGATASGVTGDFIFGTYQDNGGGQYGPYDGAVSGLNMAFAVANMTAGTWQFASPLTRYVGFAFFELTGGEAVELSLVDANDEVVGSFSSSSSSGYGPAVALPPGGGWYRPLAPNNSRFGEDFGPNGLFFTLDDFTGSGDLSTATGLRLDGESGIDPFALVAVVPEPATMGLLALGGLAVLARRRNGK
jgi:hypothetical protein